MPYKIVGSTLISTQVLRGTLYKLDGCIPHKKYHSCESIEIQIKSKDGLLRNSSAIQIQVHSQEYSIHNQMNRLKYRQMRMRHALHTKSKSIEIQMNLKRYPLGNRCKSHEIQRNPHQQLDANQWTSTQILKEYALQNSWKYFDFHVGPKGYTL